MTTTLSVHPELERLRRERALLRHEFARAVLAARDLDVVVRPYLLGLFQARLGPAELARLTADHRYRRARRALELVQASLNRGRAPDLAAIDAQFDVEPKAYRAVVVEKAAAIEQARVAVAAVMPAADAAELRRLYLELVVALHPDLHPDQPAEDRERWHRLQRAYADGDLELLRAVASLYELAPAAEDTLAAIEREVTELRERLRAVEAN